MGVAGADLLNIEGVFLFKCLGYCIGLSVYFQGYVVFYGIYLFILEYIENNYKIFCYFNILIYRKDMIKFLIEIIYK